MIDGARLRLLDFFVTHPNPCPYLPDRLEQRVVTNMTNPLAAASHDTLARAGFRRVQQFAYRPACPQCTACVPIRVDVNRFTLTRSFRRILNRNRDLVMDWRDPVATTEQYRLFSSYQRCRHEGGGMQDMGFADYADMVCETPIETRVAEFRLAGSGQLLGVGLVDFQSDGLSAVYSFFGATRPDRSLGTHIILSLIAGARALGLPYVYLGYWISSSEKMAYKSRFRPVEILTAAGWKTACMEDAAD